MKVVIIVYSPLASGKPPLFSKIASCLQNRFGIGIVAVTMGKSSREFLARCSDIQPVASYDMIDFFDNHLDDPMNAGQLAELETRYGIPNLGLYAVPAQRLFERLGEDKAWRVLVAQIKFWETMFSVEKPDAFVDEGIGGGILPVWKVARAHSVSVLNLLSARMPNRFVIQDNPFGRRTRMEGIYSALKQRVLTREEEARASSFLEDFTSHAVRPPYMDAATRPPYVTLRAPLTLARYAVDYRRGENGAKYLTVPPSPLELVERVLSRIYRYQRIARAKGIWEKPRAGEDFVLYPLHVQPENSTSVQAPFHIDQLALIENIAKSLPVNVKLYVKEHEPSIATRRVSYYQRIKSAPNTRLISPFADSHALIKNSRAVVVISSTMGWEAILYQKPVVVFGNVFYDAFDLVTKVKDVTTLPNVLHEAVNGFQPHRELLLKFITAVLVDTYDGEVVWDSPHALSDQNVINLCKAIASRVGSEGSRTDPDTIGSGIECSEKGAGNDPPNA